MLMFMGRKPHKTKFSAPGLMHQARWMAKAIYSLKVWPFRFQFKLTPWKTNGLLHLYLFLANIYIKFWFQASVASNAPRNDLHMHQLLHSYPDQDISEATSQKLAGQLWYLSEDSIVLSLFNAEVPLDTKCEIVNSASALQACCDSSSLSAAPTTVCQSLKLPVASNCDLPDDINIHEFTAAPLGLVHLLFQHQESGIHCLIICGIQLLTRNNLGETWRRICSLDIRSVSALEVLRNRARQLDMYLLTYLLTTQIRIAHKTIKMHTYTFCKK